MRINLFAIGKLKSGPERDLATRYRDRFSKIGPAIGLEFAKLIEARESRALSAKERKSDEKAQLEKVIPEKGKLIVLDESGDILTSEQFSLMIANLRDRGERDAIFAIGGADGHDQEVRDKAFKVLSLGKMTWPHQMVRIMLLEQIYRSATILSGHPYHRI